MSLESDERRELEERFRRELEEDHARRLEKVERRKAKATSRERQRAEDEHNIAVSELKERVRDDFYKQHGYKLYIDSTGREVWLTREEYEVRMRRRRGRRAKVAPSVATQRRTWMLYGAVVVLAVLLGIALAG